MNPDFGGGLRNFIFEQLTENNLESLEKNLESLIETYFPAIIVQSIDITKNEDVNNIVIEIKYSIANTNISDNIIIQI